MSDAYFQRAFPEPYRILGLSLRPMSLGRYRLLKRFDCAFVAEEEARAQLGDLIIGVLICSMRCDEFLEWAGSKDFAQDVSQWGDRILGMGFLGIPGRMGLINPPFGRWWRKRHGFNVVEKMQLFNRYISEANKLPAFLQEEGDNSASGAHWTQSMEVALRGELGWTKEEIDEEPLSKAIADYYKWLENQGAIQLLSDEQMEFYREQAEHNMRVLEAQIPASVIEAASRNPSLLSTL
jgi:hypothetical protein